MSFSNLYNFANPYNFASIDEGKIERKFHEKPGDYNGKIICRLRFLNNFITAGENNGREKRQLRIIGKYLFSWDEIPGKNSQRLTDILKSNYDVDWVKTGNIVKTDNDKTIMITAEKNILSLNLNNEKTELNLKINNRETDKFIVKNENGKLNIYNGKIGIQAPSLKGLFRATAEAISNSCISMMSDKGYKYPFRSGMPIGTLPSGVVYKIEYQKGKEYLVFDQKQLVNPNALIESCDNKKGLCLCCMLFGTSAKIDEKGEESFTFKGKIRVLDATYSGIYDTNNKIINVDPIITKYLRNHSLSSPKNHHENFYLNGNKIKGRKFYYHHKDDGLLPKKQDKTILVDLVKEDSVFEFTIYFENITKEEYGLLLTTLELEPGLGHKIGMGKPLGLGSCVIEVREIVEFTKNRYLSIDNSGEIYNEEKHNILDRKNAIKKEWTKGIPEDLKCILTLDNGFFIDYPDKNAGEFKILKFHKPCEDFDRKQIKLPASAKVSPSNPGVASSSISVQK